MSGAKHTPGPWKVTKPRCGTDELRLRVVSESTDLDVADLYWCDPTDHDATQLAADANLIAAAPDLLAALKSARAAWLSEANQGDGIDEANAPVLAAVDAVIAKAEGR